MSGYHAYTDENGNEVILCDMCGTEEGVRYCSEVDGYYCPKCFSGEINYDEEY